MKTKDMITLTVAALIIGVSGFFIYRMLVPAKSNQQASSNNQQQTETKLTGNIDEATLKIISEKKDYGEASLDNIGRTNPFGPLN